MLKDLGSNVELSSNIFHFRAKIVVIDTCDISSDDSKIRI